MNEELYEKITDSLVEDGYIVIENALNGSVSSGLLNAIKDESDFKKAGISSSDSLRLDATRRRDRTRWLNEDGGAQSEFLAFSEGLREHLNHSLYLGLKRFESHFAIYEEGDFYEKHFDSFRGERNRVVTAVYYLNENWSEMSGGELVVYDENDKELAQVIPEANTLIVFMSEKFPHEVLPAKVKRYSIASWFRVD